MSDLTHSAPGAEEKLREIEELAVKNSFRTRDVPWLIQELRSAWAELGQVAKAARLTPSEEEPEENAPWMVEAEPEPMGPFSLVEAITAMMELFDGEFSKLEHRAEQAEAELGRLRAGQQEPKCPDCHKNSLALGFDDENGIYVYCSNCSNRTYSEHSRLIDFAQFFVAPLSSQGTPSIEELKQGDLSCTYCQRKVKWTCDGSVVYRHAHDNSDKCGPEKNELINWAIVHDDPAPRPEESSQGTEPAPATPICGKSFSGLLTPNLICNLAPNHAGECYHYYDKGPEPTPASPEMEAAKELAAYVQRVMDKGLRPTGETNYLVADIVTILRRHRAAGPQPWPEAEEIAAQIVRKEGLDLNPTEYSDLLDTVDSVLGVLQRGPSPLPGAEEPLSIKDLARRIVARIYEVPCSTPTPIVEAMLSQFFGADLRKKLIAGATDSVLNMGQPEDGISMPPNAVQIIVENMLASLRSETKAND